MRKTIVKVLILTAICILSFAGCDSQNGVADNSASVNPTTGATSTVENNSTAKPTETKKEPTKVPTKEPTQVPTQEPTLAPTQAPTSIPTNAQPTADPAIYPDDFGEAGPNNSYRTDGKVFFWTKTRHMVEIPEELQGKVYPDVVDEANAQAVFSTGFLKHGTLTYYSIRDGVIYKLNQGKIVKECFNGYNAFGWLEEDGTACSIGERSKWWNEVYIEGTQCKAIFYKVSLGGKLVVVNEAEEVVEPNKEDILREAIIVK